MAGKLQDVLDDIETVASGIAGMRYFAYPPHAAQPPFMFPADPVVTYDATMARGVDRYQITVFVGTPDAVGRTSWATVADWADGANIKAELEGNVGDSCRVTEVRFGHIGLAEGTYLGAQFTLDVIA